MEDFLYYQRPGCIHLDLALLTSHLMSTKAMSLWTERKLSWDFGGFEVSSSWNLEPRPYKTFSSYTLYFIKLMKPSFGLNQLEIWPLQALNNSSSYNVTDTKLWVFKQVQAFQQYSIGRSNRTCYRRTDIQSD